MPQTVTSVGATTSGGSVADDLRAALEEANIPTLVGVLAHVTGDDRWLAEPYRIRRSKGLGDNDSGGLSEQAQAEVRAAAWEVTKDFRAGRLTPPELTADRVVALLERCLDEEVPLEYGPLLSEELGLTDREVDFSSATLPSGFTVLVIGSGLSGLCAAIKLKAAGISFTVLEKNSSVGGTWHENTYPGCGVDTPSHFYSFSFAQNTQWSRYFTKRGQLAQYLEDLADDFEVRDSIMFGTEVQSASYDEESATWRVEVRHADGLLQVMTTSVLVTAVGVVNRPSLPAIPGLESFEGPVMHTAEWQQDVSLTGKRVAVIGTGASAMQLVPTVVDETERILIFQRSKQWALPHPNYQREVTPGIRLLMEVVPFYAGWYRLRTFWNFSDRLHASLQIDPDWEHPERSINASNESHRLFLTEYIKSELAQRPDLLDACLPDYPPYGKRMLIDNGWFRTVARDDVDLITEGVTEVREHSVIDSGGVEHHIDVIILATGFKSLQFLWPMEIRGSEGTTLRETWGEEDARAYLGLTVPGFPNLFILNGPNTNAGHGGSAVIAIEFQVRYLMQALKELVVRDTAAIEVCEEAFDAYNAELDVALSHLIWTHPGMTTYYRNSSGRIVTTSPWKYVDYWRRTLQFDADDYAFVEASRLSSRRAAG